MKPGVARKIYGLIGATVVALAACHKSDSSHGSGPGASGPTIPLPPPIEAQTGGPAPAVTGANRGSRILVSSRTDELWRLGQSAATDMNLVCARGYMGGIKQAASVTHYYIPPNTTAGDYRCRNGFGYFGQPNMAGTCLHPCRSLAADPRFHRPGEVIFFKNLVGLKCGSGANQMIHDGFMVVTDNGNPEVINIEGRFGTFWGRCQTEQNGFCLDDGAIAMDFALTFSEYCRTWRPQDPLHHSDLKLALYNQIRSEAAHRGDNQAASSFDLDAWIGIGLNSSGILYHH